MQTLFLILAAFYVLMMPILFLNWLSFFRADQELSSEEERMSWIVIAIATLFWFIVLPFAYLELANQLERTQKTARLYQHLLDSK